MQPLLVLHSNFFQARPVNGKIDQIRTQANGWDIDQCAHIPAKTKSNLLEYNDGRNAWAYVEQIQRTAGCFPEDKIQRKCQYAKSQVYGSCVEEILFCLAAHIGEAKEQTHKHQQHMPGHRMEGQEPVALEKSRGFCKGDRTAEKVIVHHKTVKAFL